MPMFRTKSVVVEARLVTLDNVDDIAQWCGGYADFEPHVMMETRDGIETAAPDDYVIEDRGVFYPMKPDVFAATYDPIEEVGKVERTMIG